jgi:hypothetical protein
METRYLFIVTAAVETGAGVALAARPSAAVALVFGSTLSSSAGVAVGRLAGAALLALGAACWQSRHDGRSSAARGLIRAMLLYNGAATAVLAHAGAVTGLHGIVLWPGVVLHSVLLAWCLTCLRLTR